MLDGRFLDFLEAVFLTFGGFYLLSSSMLPPISFQKQEINGPTSVSLSINSRRAYDSWRDIAKKRKSGINNAEFLVTSGFPCDVETLPIPEEEKIRESSQESESLRNDSRYREMQRELKLTAVSPKRIADWL